MDSTTFEDLLRLLHQQHQREISHWQAQCGIAGVSSVLASEQRISMESQRISTVESAYTAPDMLDVAHDLRGSLGSFSSLSLDGLEHTPSSARRTDTTKSSIRAAKSGKSSTFTSSGMTAETSIPPYLLNTVDSMIATQGRTSVATSNVKAFVEAWGIDESVFTSACFFNRFSNGKTHPCPWWHARAKLIKDAVWFEVAIMLVIIANGAITGLQANLNAVKPQNAGKKMVFTTAENVFTIVFLLELVLRFLGESGIVTFFWTSEKAAWNSFDFLLCCMDVMDLIIVADRNMAGALRIVRMLRVCRVFRILRVMVWFKDARILVLSLTHCYKSLLSLLILVLVILYIFSIFFVQITTANLKDGWDEDDDLHMKLKKYFDGGVFGIVYYLFQSVSGGLDWGEFAELLQKVGGPHGGPLNVAGMSSFIFFLTMGLLNIITGIFVESVLNSVKSDTEEVVSEQLRDENSILKRLKQIFDDADTSQTGNIRYAEFEAMMNDDRSRALMASVGLKPTKIRGLFKLMDLDNSGSISIDEFLLQCVRLSGEAKSVDLMTLMYENKKMMNKFAELTRFLHYHSIQSSTFQEQALAKLHFLQEYHAKPKRAFDSHLQSIAEVEDKLEACPTFVKL